MPRNRHRAKLDFDARQGVTGLKVGYLPTMDEGAAGHRCGPLSDRNLVAASVSNGHGLRSLPTGRTTGSLHVLLFTEAAAAFEDTDLEWPGRGSRLKVQVPDAWPNLFREARFLSAVDFVQADRLRRKVAQ